jgi:hypothetical protein
VLAQGQSRIHSRHYKGSGFISALASIREILGWVFAYQLVSWWPRPLLEQSGTALNIKYLSRHVIFIDES